MQDMKPHKANLNSNLRDTMGYYINPKDMTKEQWLRERATAHESIPEWETARAIDRLPVCWVHNGLFTAAGVAFDQREHDVFAGESHRPTKWFTASIVDLIEVGALPKDWKG